MILNSKKAIALGLVGLMSLQGSLATSYAAELNQPKLSVAQDFSANKDVYQEALQRMIEQGYLSVDSDNNILVTEKYETYVQERNPNSVVIADGNSIIIQNLACANDGVTKFEWTWKGFDLWLDNDACRHLEAGLGLSAFVCSKIPDPTLITKIIEGIVVFGIAVIMCQNLGNGVIIAFAGGVPHWVSSQ